MLQQQGNRCAICEVPLTDAARVSVDHSHSDGTVRGLLCNACNVFLGHARDSTAVLRNAILYLQKWNKI